MAWNNQQLTEALGALTTKFNTLYEQNVRLREANINARETLEAVRANGPPQRPPPIPRQLHLSYGGSEQEDWLTFKRKFLTHTVTQRYSNGDAKRQLLTCMHGQAFHAVTDLDHEDDNQDLADLISIYEAMFLPPSASQMAITKYEAAAQQPTESILQFHGRLAGLWNRAYPGEALGKQVIRRYANALRNKNIRQFVLRAEPTTYANALKEAQKEQAVQDSTGFHSTLSATGYTPAAPRADRGEPMEIGAIGEQKRCYTCNLFGHEKKDCKYQRKPVVPGGRPPPPRSGGAAATRAGGAKTGSSKPSRPPTSGANSTPVGNRGKFVPRTRKYLAPIGPDGQEEEEEPFVWAEDGDYEEYPEGEDQGGHEDQDGHPGDEAPEN